MLEIVLRKLILFMLLLQSWDAEVTMSARISKLVLLRSVEIPAKTKLVLRLRFARSSITTPGVSSVSLFTEFTWLDVAFKILVIFSILSLMKSYSKST